VVQLNQTLHVAFIFSRSAKPAVQWQTKERQR